MKKVKILLFSFSLFFLLILLKLFFIQIAFSSSSFQNYLKYKKIYPERGHIYDRSGKPLVLNQRTFLLYLEPKKITSRESVIRDIDSILKIGESTLEAKIDKNKEWLAIASGITKNQREKLEGLKTPGIGFEDQSKRFYPEASLAAHLFGFVGKTKEGESTGYFGVEGYYDKDLSGLLGLVKSEQDILGRPILLGTQDRVVQENGSNLYLTIEAGVQRILKEELKKGLERYKAKSGCIITADPYTMEIIGIVCLPDFDPDRYYEFSQNDFKNPALSSVYEPGSTFKPLIMAAAINEKKVKPTDLYNEKGPVERGGYTIKTWNEKYEGKITMTRILEKSSNVGMVYVGDKLGQDNLLKYIHAFGFGSQTGIDLQGEITGVIKGKSAWYPIDYATAAFGQGIAVTPIAMITAFSSLINGGELIKPSVVKKIVYDHGEKTISDKPQERVISEKTSEIIKKMLVSTVDRGEYKWTIPEGYRIGGKTGTAQIPIKGHYDTSKTIASFIGFAPAKEPKFITLVILQEPGTSPWGSETAAPLFFDIARRLFIYYNIAPGQ